MPAGVRDPAAASPVRVLRVERGGMAFRLDFGAKRPWAVPTRGQGFKNTRAFASAHEGDGARGIGAPSRESALT